MILCCGEALVDMVPRTSSASEACFAPFAGGAVFNTSIALGRLGSNSGYFGGISKDLFGQILIDGLTKSDVDTSVTVRSDRPTTLAFVELVDGQARYAFYDEGTAGRMLTPSDIPEDVTAYQAMFFGGISLVVEPCAQVFETLMAQAKPDCVTMIDPNIRPGFISDEAAYRARLDRMIANADIIKLSDEDLVWLRGEGTLKQLAHDLLKMGPKLVFITEGAKGAHGFTATAACFVPSKRVDVVDTIGAGDTFNAGILNALDTAGLLTKNAISSIGELEIEIALKRGAETAAVTVSRAGANPPWQHELD
jgi:fructokinase